MHAAENSGTPYGPLEWFPCLLRLLFAICSSARHSCRLRLVPVFPFQNYVNLISLIRELQSKNVGRTFVGNLQRSPTAWTHWTVNVPCWPADPLLRHGMGCGSRGCGVLKSLSVRHGLVSLYRPFILRKSSARRRVQRDGFSAPAPCRWRRLRLILAPEGDFYKATRMGDHVF